MRAPVPAAGLAASLALLAPWAGHGETVTVGSKLFTESVILGELARLSAPDGLAVRHRREMGGTRILYSAIVRGDIDVYPEYTGTLIQETLDLAGEYQLDAALARDGLARTRPLGFDNTYALGLRRQRAEALGVETISDLAAHPGLVLGFSNEFINRADGWPGLSRHYGLTHRDVRGLSHDLAYRGLAAGDIDVIDVYSTDADIRYYELAVLEDDRGFFPSYEAIYVYRQDLTERAPGLVAALHRLEGTLDEAAMIALNARVKLGGESETVVAADTLGIAAPGTAGTLPRRLAQRTVEHLVLVGLSLAIAIALAIPAGILAHRRPGLGQWLLSTAGVLQTIPSLALLVMLIPLLGIGARSAIVALILYSILPILRNTHAGLAGIPVPLRESALALGIGARDRLLRVELPLARGAILAGIKTAAVINVGTATLGALIGAGGYGQPILTGIRLDDTGLILEGALPAAALALAIQYGFERLEPDRDPN